MNEHAFEEIASALPPGRYREVLRHVLTRLPEGWDYYRTLSVELSPEKPARGIASSLREEELETAADDPPIEGHNEQVWTVTLFQPWLDGFSDLSVMWVIAHELGHVASGMACGSMALGGKPYTRVSGTNDHYREKTPEEISGGEKVADAIARAWGFWLEEETFEAEALRLK
ncbi:MAG: hypothetical protein Q7W02_02410 [Candidatus Rokubacteria bacterium]|nr:hypothetical protein [Candidatus Rokubacteria bacterium]